MIFLEAFVSILRCDWIKEVDEVWIHVLYYDMLFWVNQNIAQKQWQEFTPLGQQFKVLVPGIMTNGQKKILTDIGEMRPETWMCQGSEDDPNKLYIVSYVDYPEATFHPDSTTIIDELFQVSLETHLKDLSGQLTYQTASNYNQNPACFIEQRTMITN
ncbi:MAG: hypothetical protein IPJ39_20835 [Saprospiraceae bacterium]|nr:hypothetical protein [Saprospiraceae bacterium]